MIDPIFEGTHVGRVGSVRGSLLKLSVIKSLFCKPGDLVVVRSNKLEKDKIAEVKDSLNHILAKSYSPYLVQHFCFFETPNRLFTVMEFCSDGNLESLLVKKEKSRTLFSESEIEKMMAQLIVGLYILHCELDIVHGELNTENILLSKSNLKIADFPTSRLDQFERTDKFSDAKLKKKTNSKKADIYDLGVIIKQVVSVRGMIDFETHGSISCVLRTIIRSMLVETSDDRPDVIFRTRQSELKSGLINYPFVRRSILQLPKNTLPKSLKDTLAKTSDL